MTDLEAMNQSAHELADILQAKGIFQYEFIRLLAIKAIRRYLELAGALPQEDTS